MQTEDAVNNPFCKYLAPRGLDKRAKALSLQLVRPDDGEDDEYYFQNVDDGKYLVVKYDEWSSDHQGDYYRYDDNDDEYDPESQQLLPFEESQSEATLFRIKEYGPLPNADLDLRIGCEVTYDIGYG